MRRSVGAFGAVVLAVLVWACSGSFFFAEDRIGVVLMHGKGGRPGAAIDGLAGKLSAAAFWSKRRRCPGLEIASTTAITRNRWPKSTPPSPS